MKVKVLVLIVVCGLASCADFSPTVEQIDATTSLVRVVLDLNSGK